MRAYRRRAQALAAEDHFRATLIWTLVTPHQKEMHRKPSPTRPAILDEE